MVRELFYYDKETLLPTEDDRYDPTYDDSIVNLDDTRKTRLTLRQLNRARKASELLYLIVLGFIYLQLIWTDRNHLEAIMDFKTKPFVNFIKSSARLYFQGPDVEEYEKCAKLLKIRTL